MEQLEYNLLFRWFVGIGVEERGAGSFGVSKNRGLGLHRHPQGQAPLIVQPR